MMRACRKLRRECEGASDETQIDSGGSAAGGRRVDGGRGGVSEVRPITGTRLDVVATGDVARVPDLVRINAGVVTQAPTAVEAIRQNAARMEAVRAALRAAGIADRDIQTSNLNLNPNYRYAENQPPQLVGYQAVNEVSVRFRDIAKTGAILDALVAQGANQINGPTLTIERPEAALDEAPAERSPTRAPGPISTRGAWACGWRGCCRSAKRRWDSSRRRAPAWPGAWSRTMRRRRSSRASRRSISA